MASLLNRFGRSVLNPITIALGYAAVSTIWIIFSDQIVAFAGGDMSVAHLTRLQTLKGILYITLTAGFIYLLISLATRQVLSSRHEMEAMKERFLQLFEGTDAIILITDEADSVIVEANAAAQRFYGWSKKELTAKKVADLAVHDPAGAPGDDFYPADRALTYARHRLASGEEREVAISATPVAARDRRVNFLLINDITERRMLERQLRQSQKMEAVGRLTGGIAHDLNNVLTVVMADADLLAAELKDTDEEVREDLDDLRAAARRGASMIRKLLSFSRSVSLKTVTIELGQAVEELIPSLRRLLPESTELVIRRAAAGTVKVDLVALEQILVNLVTNARDAMPAEGGKVTIETGLDNLDAAQQYPWVRPGRYVSLKVRDDGIGMDDRIQARMFEPFFTTKPPTEGNGLGMAMVYGLVKQHEGFVLVKSKPGSGTTVSIYLPQAPKLDQVDVVPVEPPPVAAGGGGETILLVEDEDALRRAGQRILEKLGYKVIVAPHGQRGLEILEEKGDTIDLVITDMIMPRIGGRALYEAARLKRDNIRFLFTSGYAPSGPGDENPLPDAPFIQKPWTFDELKRKVREVLDSKY
jgi:two-component system, cell cycle sensor histidine kinase and response regulator CckA